MNPPEQNTPRSSRSKRRFRNWLLQPVLQIRLGLYTIALSGLFSIAVFMVLYHNLVDFTDIVVTLTDSESEIRDLFSEYMATTQWWLISIVGFYFVTTVCVSVVFTHRLVGPTVSFVHQIRRLRNNDFSERVQLRKGDAFVEVADELNLLTEHLQRASQPK